VTPTSVSPSKQLQITHDEFFICEHFGSGHRFNGGSPISAKSFCFVTISFSWGLTGIGW
jgi:hypothetical protein